MPILQLALKSLANRWSTAALTVFTVAVSVMLLLGVERIRTEAKESFSNTVSGTDVIVGARGGAIQLLLYSVFRIGNATNNISWDSYQSIARRQEVAWTIPISLGDSHRGFRVLGTDRGYFEHFRYSRRQRLAFSSGGPFEDLFDAVIGADVAAALGYRLGDPLVIAHGLGDVGFATHKDKPFHVAGIIAKTGTPVDRTVHVSLEAIEAIHVDWQSGSRMRGLTVDAETVRRMNLRPKAVTAVLVGLKSRLSAFALQREINLYRGEPLLAILPGIALQELWSLMGTAETALATISLFVVVAGLLGMLTTLLASLNERRREMAVLRSVGARPLQVFGLLVTEATMLAAAGALLGVLLLYAGLFVAQPVVEARWGLYIAVDLPTARDLAILGAVLAAGMGAGAIPAWRAYRQSIADGMIVRY